jgi:hypothetical protein
MGDPGTREPIFEKWSHLPEKGAVLMLLPIIKIIKHTV